MDNGPSSIGVTPLRLLTPRRLGALPHLVPLLRRLPATARTAVTDLDASVGRLRLHLGALGRPKKGVADGVEGADALGGVVLEHLHDEVLELEVVDHRVPRLAQPPPVRPARLDAEHVIERARLAVARMSQHIPRALVALAEVLEPPGPRLDHASWRRAEQLIDLDYLVRLVLPREEGLARVHLDEDATEAPHVDGARVGAAEQHLGRAVEARLDVRLDGLPVSTRRAEVDQLDRRPLGMSQQDVLRLEVAVDDRHVAQLQKA
eukprot:7378732-Prymnesium_polylepis.2